MHKTKPNYGSSSIEFYQPLRPLLFDVGAKRVLEYGAGRSRLIDTIKQQSGISAERYDPAIPDMAILPKAPFDLVFCIDVMEHIPENEVGKVLADIRNLSQKAFFHVSTRYARAILPNGENAHATVKPAAWWHAKLAEHFCSVVPLREREDQFTCITWKPQFFLLWLSRLLVAIRYGKTRQKNFGADGKPF